jgi:Double-GTPase 2
MDELIGFFFMMMLVMLALFVAGVMAAAGAVVGSALVGLGGTWEFLRSAGRRIARRGGEDRRPLDPEPAFELYVAGQLGRDLRSAASDSWESMQRLRAMTVSFWDSHREGMGMPLGIGALVGGFVGVALGAVVAAILTLPVVVVAGVVVVGAWLLIGVLRAAEALRRKVRRTSYECPVDHERFPLPVYVCPSCGAEHRRLVPGRWGIVKRECRCGAVALPTMVLNGRQRVPQQCPSGHSMAGIIGYTEMLRIALVAGPRAGKSTFLAGALHELDGLSKDGKLALAVVEDSRKDFDAALDDLEHGRLPAKTQTGANPALVAEVQGEGRSRVLSLYDVAGESYTGEDQIRDLRFLEVPSGLVLLVDPLSLDRLATDRGDEIAALEDRLRPSPTQPIRVLERTVEALQAAGARLDRLAVAVVVAKADALEIGDEIVALEDGEGERAIPAWLDRQGGGNFVRAVEDEFAKVGWFHASALGRIPDPADQASFVPSGTADPVLWLLAQNGLAPAKRRFAPERASDRLAGASAEDFPPISTAGWAWRAVAPVTASLAVMGLLAFGAVAGISALDTGGSVSDPGDSASAAVPAAETLGEDVAADDGYEPTLLPDVPRWQMESDIEDLLLTFHRNVIDGDYGAAWDLLTPRKRAQTRREQGYAAWSQAQATLRNDLDPEGLRARVIAASPTTGVARVDVTGMTWSKPGASCVEWSGLTWVKYENDSWLYDPGYSTTALRRAQWEDRFSELLGGSC